MATEPTEPGNKAKQDVNQERLQLRSHTKYLEKVDDSIRLAGLKDAFQLIQDRPYCIVLHVLIAIKYLGLDYPDLAAGSAYKALLLSDAIEDIAEEYHEEATEALRSVILKQPIEEKQDLFRSVNEAITQNSTSLEQNDCTDEEVHLWLKAHYRLILYRVLVRSLLQCDCLRSAESYALQALKHYPTDTEILELRNQLEVIISGSGSTNGSSTRNPTRLPNNGLVRREIYPWNDHEPNRLNELKTLNAMMQEVAPKLEVRIVNLPALSEGPGDTIAQLGVYATEDIPPGHIVLDETSLLTANNKLQDALCDACSSDLPPLHSPEAQNVVSCLECQVAVFCSQKCFEQAMELYHPALCDHDVEAIAKDVPPAEAADALYSLLLLRAFALAETQQIHPLDLRETKYIWGDFTTYHHHQSQNIYNGNDRPIPFHHPRTLPFSFEHNIRLPFHMLEKMDIDIFARAADFDVWVFNTLYAKFRGTASARLSGLGGRPLRGPEVSAVHPLWCLANHSCDPNVSWDWGGSVKFRTREERVKWKGRDGMVKKKKMMMMTSNESRAPGIRKGEEVWNHYCDVELSVDERREWARGALGGDCRCARCVFEAGEEGAAAVGE